jgi:hypothetical protein
MKSSVKSVLAVDVGGSSVKILATGQSERRSFSSGPTLTPRRMVTQVKKLAGDWTYDVVRLALAWRNTRAAREHVNSSPGAIIPPSRGGSRWPRTIRIRQDASVTTAEPAIAVGVCVLCSRGCHFVSKRDRRGYFRFVPIQMAEGRPLADQLGIDPDRPDSFAFVANGQGYVKSEAVLRIARELPRWRRHQLSGSRRLYLGARGRVCPGRTGQGRRGVQPGPEHCRCDGTRQTNVFLEFPISAYRALTGTDGLPVDWPRIQSKLLISTMGAHGLEPWIR